VPEVEDSYDVYIKIGENWAGQDQWSDGPIAHFKEERNALKFKRQLEAQGQTAHVEKSTIQGLSEVTRSVWFADYGPSAP
jgi:hypothetical protein